MGLNKILTSINGRLKVLLYGITDPNAAVDTLEGHPLGTSDQSTTGEIGVKVIVIGSRGPQAGQFNIGAYDAMTFDYYGSTNNIEHQKFYTGGTGGTLVATLTYTYIGSGVANDDEVATIVQS